MPQEVCIEGQSLVSDETKLQEKLQEEMQEEENRCTLPDRHSWLIGKKALIVYSVFICVFIVFHLIIAGIFGDDFFPSMQTICLVNATMMLVGLFIPVLLCFLKTRSKNVVVRQIYYFRILNAIKFLFIFQCTLDVACIVWTIMVTKDYSRIEVLFLFFPITGPNFVLVCGFILIELTAVILFLVFGLFFGIIFSCVKIGQYMYSVPEIQQK